MTIKSFCIAACHCGVRASRERARDATPAELRAGHVGELIPLAVENLHVVVVILCVAAEADHCSGTERHRVHSGFQSAVEVYPVLACRLDVARRHLVELVAARACAAHPRARPLRRTRLVARAVAPVGGPAALAGARTVGDALSGEGLQLIGCYQYSYLV